MTQANRPAICFVQKEDQPNPPWQPIGHGCSVKNSYIIRCLETTCQQPPRKKLSNEISFCPGIPRLLLFEAAVILLVSQKWSLWVTPHYLNTQNSWHNAILRHARSTKIMSKFCKDRGYSMNFTPHLIEHVRKLWGQVVDLCSSLHASQHLFSTPIGNDRHASRGLEAKLSQIFLTRSASRYSSTGCWFQATKQHNGGVTMKHVWCHNSRTGESEPHQVRCTLAWGACLQIQIKHFLQRFPWKKRRSSGAVSATFCLSRRKGSDLKLLETRMRQHSMTGYGCFQK